MTKILRKCEQCGNGFEPEDGMETLCEDCRKEFRNKEDAEYEEWKQEQKTERR